MKQFGQIVDKLNAICHANGLIEDGTKRMLSVVYEPHQICVHISAPLNGTDKNSEIQKHVQQYMAEYAAELTRMVQQQLRNSNESSDNNENRK
jgi:hypothetical protein